METSRLRVGLGIDVGGTFSDSVLIDLDTGRILSKAKSPTTHDDLVIGIEESVGLLARDLFPSIRLVSLSTTLATNALVEGRRSRVAAILPGYPESSCPGEFRAEIHRVSGGHTAEGKEAAPLDLEGVERIIESTRGEVDAYAVSAYFSTRNPSHERAVEERVGKLSSDTPIALGHELSQKLDAERRATTTILNAHLIPIIRRLLVSVSSVLDRYAIHAPLMVVKGDGSLFRKEMCMIQPVETILSGPAASVVGAGFLTGRSTEDAVVIDIGGTTSDIALLQGGVPKLNETGVTVGPWQTHVTAVDVRTLGLGGDSHIRIDAGGEILVGPRRVEPLCLLGERFPDLLVQMKRAISQPHKDVRFAPTAFWYATGKAGLRCLDEREEEILHALSEGPLNIFQIAQKLGTYPVTIRESLRRLEDRNRVVRAGFTPTDIFHVRGLHTSGHRDCSEMAAEYLAGEAGMDVERFLTKFDEILNRRLALEVVDGLSGRPVGYSGRAAECPACDQTWNNCFWEGGETERKSRLGLFKMRLSLDATIVGIGAPAHVLVPPFARRIDAAVDVPEHAEVANALGAIVGSILINEQVLIRPLPLEGFACFSSSGKSVAPTIDQAIEQGRMFLTDHLRSQAERAGGNGVELTLWEERKNAALSSGDEHLIEVVLHGRAVAKPRLEARPGGPDCRGR